VDPVNPLAIRRLAGYAEHNGDWEKSLELKERLIFILVEEDEKFALTMELGEMCYEKLGRPHQAIDFYRQASFSQPENTAVLYKLWELNEETQQWDELIEVIELIIGLEEDLDKQLRFTYRIAEIYQNQLTEIDQAIEYYNKALDLNYLYDAAFQALEGLLFGFENWQSLDENYRKMIQRLPQDDSQNAKKLELWKKLGDLHRYKLENVENAVTAYELVYQLEDTIPNLEILAELYGKKDTFRPKAIQVHHQLLAKNAARIDSYKSLVRLYYEAQQYDKSFAVCSTLRFLREASPEEEQFYKSMKGKGSDRVKRAFREEETWKQVLFHPYTKTPLADILSILYQFCGAEFAQRTKEFKIKKGDRVDPNLFFSRTYEYVGQVLGLTGREVYQTALFPSLRVVNTFPPVLLAGEDMFKERHPKELLFMITRQLTHSRPEFLFATVLPYAQYRALISTFLNVYVPSIPLEVPQETADRLKAIFNKALPAERKEQLGHLVQQYVQDPNRVQPDQFLEGIEHTVNRVGFCLSGDLNIASQVCERDGRDDFQIPHRTKVKELVLFSVDPAYFGFRDSQGLSVKV